MQWKMRTKNEPKPEHTQAKARKYALELIVSMADTTWRMFVPPALLVSAGLWSDLHFDTKPWLTIVGLLVGLSGSVVLVRAQLRGGA